MTGRAFAQAWAPGAIGVIWGRRGLAGRCLQMAGRRLLTVEPGPLLSPYDSPERGLSSLRFTLDGVPFGGEAGIHAFDPWTRQPITLDECRDRVAWLERRFRDNDSLTVLVGISRWKRPALDVFVGGPAGKPVYAMNAEEAVAKARSRGQAGKARILRLGDADAGTFAVALRGARYSPGPDRGRIPAVGGAWSEPAAGRFYRRG